MSRRDNYFGRRSMVLEPAGGSPRFGYGREMPEGIARPIQRDDLTEFLPGNLRREGWQLLGIGNFQKRDDPYVLYNPWGEKVAEWEQAPSFGELLQFELREVLDE